MAPKPKPGPSGSRKIIGTATSSYPKQLVQGSMATQSKIVEKKPGKKPSTKYSPAPMSDAAKAKARIAAAKKQPSLTSKAGKVAGKVAGKAAGIAKSKVKADIKAAKTIAGFAAKAYQFPGEMAFKAGKALAKTPTKKLYSNKNMKKK